MVKLISFQSGSDLPDLEGELSITKAGSLQIEYRLNKTQGIADLPNECPSPVQWKRANGLWQKTCFELFIAKPNETSYWEFNFSPLGFWNSYSFNDYRLPQPPTIDESWTLKDARWDGHTLNVTIQPLQKTIQNIVASLCAVVRMTDSKIHYYSHQHIGAKPDFHLRQSLSIKRSAT